MSILKSIYTSNKTLVTFHVFDKLVFSANDTVAVLQYISYVDEEAYLTSTPYAWMLNISVPLNIISDVSINTLDSLAVSTLDSSLYSGTVLTPLSNLDQVKLYKNFIIKQLRDVEEYQGFLFRNRLFDSDRSSQQRIQGAVQLAMLAISNNNNDFKLIWTLKDGSFMSLNSDDTINLGIVLGEFIQKVFNKCQLLQQQIVAATTKEEVEAITWQATT